METHTHTEPAIISQLQCLQYNILSTVEFLVDQLEEIQKAEERIWIQTMALEPGHFTDLMVRYLIDAKQRGVDVRVVHDAYTDYIIANTFNQLPFLLNRKERGYKDILLKRQAEQEDLLKKHLPLTKTNVPNRLLRLTPLPAAMSRDHKKISVIDHQAYLGGENLTPLDAKRADFMLKTNNPDLVSALSNVFCHSFYDVTVSDSLIPCDANNALLVDAGKKSQSLIMEQVQSAVETENDSITLISPFLPLGKFRSVLNRAVRRGVSVEVITSDEKQSGFAPKLSQFVHNVGQVPPLFSITHCREVVHAKLLLFGNHKAILGSHNFDEVFVRLGTEEVSLLTTQPEVITQLMALCNRLKLPRVNETH